MKILGSRYRLRKPDALESPEEELAKRQAEHQANFERLTAHKAEILSKIDELKARIELNELKKNARAAESAVRAQSKYRWPVGEDRILFLPAGDVRGAGISVMEFEVTARTADLLNKFATSLFDVGLSPWLDLVHDEKSPTFLISKFEFESDAGVFAVGRYTALGRTLYNAGRISGVSVTVPITDDRKALCPAFDVQISEQEAEWLKNAAAAAAPPAPEANIEVMGAVLLDGVKSALQTVVTWRKEWAQVLKQMERNGAIDEEKIPASES